MIRATLAAVASLVAPMSAADAAVCRISGKAMIEAAASLGKGSAARPQEGTTTTCTESWPAVTVGAGEAAPGACEVAFMQGATLADGWSIPPAAIRMVGGAAFRFKAPRQLRSLAFTVIATVPAGTSENISLKDIKLVGPDCNDWQSAIQ